VFLVWLLLLSSTGICIAGEYQVSRVVDGDTIIVKKGDTKLTIRLVGIDAPEISHAKNEPGQPFSQQSTKHLAGLVLNRVVVPRVPGLSLEDAIAGADRLERGTPTPQDRAAAGVLRLHADRVRTSARQSHLAERFT
jgi:hypothetical protein